jgi:hypothetical protein
LVRWSNACTAIVTTNQNDMDIPAILKLQLKQITLSASTRAWQQYVSQRHHLPCPCINKAPPKAI